jgi:DNA-binding Xre family transcriptional regulator
LTFGNSCVTLKKAGDGYMEITKTIKKVMIDKDIQVGELADKYVISRQNFSRILNAGDRNKIETLIKIADLLDCNVEITLIDRETGKKYNCE